MSTASIPLPADWVQLTDSTAELDPVTRQVRIAVDRTKYHVVFARRNVLTDAPTPLLSTVANGAVVAGTAPGDPPINDEHEVTQEGVQTIVRPGALAFYNVGVLGSNGFRQQMEKGAKGYQSNGNTLTVVASPMGTPLTVGNKIQFEWAKSTVGGAEATGFGDLTGLPTDNKELEEALAGFVTQEELEVVRGTLPLTESRTADYTLQPSDVGRLVPFLNAGPAVLTFPNNATAPIPVGKIGYIRRQAGGALSLQAGSGVQLMPPNVGLNVDEYARVSYQKIDLNTYWLEGSLF